MNGVSSDYRAMSPGTSYAISVGVTLKGKDQVWSHPTPFHTQLQPSQYAAAALMWATNTSAEYIMLRREIGEPAPDQQLFLAVSAKPSPDWHFPHGRNTSHLLCGYKLWVNGVPLGAGPGRIVGNGIEYNYSVGGSYTDPPPPIPLDTFNLTALVAQGKGATIAIESYYRSCNVATPAGKGCSDTDPTDDPWRAGTHSMPR